MWPPVLVVALLASLGERGVTGPTVKAWQPGLGPRLLGILEKAQRDQR